jgi:stress-induced-phosphoprotein 1
LIFFFFSKALELKNAGNEFFAKGDHKKAIESFTEAISLDPTNHVLYSNRAASHTSLRDFSNALLDAEKTIELNPSFVKVRIFIEISQC